MAFKGRQTSQSHKILQVQEKTNSRLLQAVNSRSFGLNCRGSADQGSQLFLVSLAANRLESPVKIFSPCENPVTPNTLAF